MNAQDEIILLLSPVKLNNHSQNIENLAYFENVLKTLLDDNFIFFSRNIEEERTRARFVLKKNEQTFLFI